MEKFFAANPIVDDVIAAGVSGGADSLALALRLNDWAKKNKHPNIGSYTGFDDTMEKIS